MSSHSLTLEERLAFEPYVSRLDPAIRRFCDESSFAPSRELGTFPGRLLRHQGEVSLIIQICLSVRPSGGYDHEFFPEIPFEFSYNAFLDRDPITYWYGISRAEYPFCVLEERVGDLLRHANDELRGITPEEAITFGKCLDRRKQYTLEEVAIVRWGRRVRQ